MKNNNSKYGSATAGKLTLDRIRGNLSSIFYPLTSKIYPQIATIFLISISVVFTGRSQSLDDYLLQAAENNPGLKSSYLEFEAAVQKTAQVKALPDPVLSFGYFVSPVETRVGPQRAKFSLVQMFPWFGTNGTKAEVSELNAQAKYHEFLDRKNELFYQVKARYYPLHEIKDQIKWQLANLEILETYKRLSTNAFSNGKGAMVDVIRVDIMIDNATTELKLLEDKIKPMEVDFNRLLNRPDRMKVDVLDSIEIVSLEYQYRKNSLLEKNPTLQTIDMKIRGAQAMEEVANKQGLPSFGVGIDYAIVGKRTDINVPDNGKDVLMPMVTMSLPLFRGKYKASIKEAQLTQSALSYKKQEIENQLVSSYEQTWYEVEKAKQLNELYDLQIVKTKQAIDLLYSAYANSGKDFIEVLRMEQQLLKYEMAKTTAAKNINVALAKLDYITATD